VPQVLRGIQQLQTTTRTAFQILEQRLWIQTSFLVPGETCFPSYPGRFHTPGQPLFGPALKKATIP